MLRSLSLQSFVVNLLILGAGFATSVLLARGLDPTGRGEIAAAMLWPMLFVYLASLGLTEAILYFAARPDARLPAIFATTLALALLQSAIVLLPGFLLTPWLLASQSADVVRISRVYLLVIPISLLTQYTTSIIHARFQITSLNLLRLMIPVGYLVGVVALAGLGELEVARVVNLNLGLNALLLLVALLRARPVWGLRPDRQLARDLLRFGLVSHLGSLSQGANLKLDQAVLAGRFAPADLGLYVVAVSASSVTQALSMAITTVLRPTITRLPERAVQEAQLGASFRRYWTLSLLLSLAVGANLFWAIPVIFGDAFRGAVWPAQVLLAAAWCAGAKEVLAGGTRALGEAWLSSKADIVAAAVTIALLVALLPRFGIMGAALATLGAYACALGVLLHGIARLTDIRIASLFRFDADVIRFVVHRLGSKTRSRASAVAIRDGDSGPGAR